MYRACNQPAIQRRPPPQGTAFTALLTRANKHNYAQTTHKTMCSDVVAACTKGTPDLI
jgi:hypothetical protein